MTDIYVQIGKRIRQYRKLNNCTLDQLAAHLCKSKATVSKYESGEIAITVEIIMQIAEFFGITVQQLIDFPKKAEISAAKMNSAYFDEGLYYCYYTVDCSDKVLTGVLELTEWDGSSFTATYYSTVKDLSNYTNCEHLYYGKLQQFTSYANFIGQNQVNEAETMFINLLTPFNNNHMAIGIISAISEIYRMPMAFKVMVSRRKLSPDEIQKNLLTTKEELGILKKYNAFIHVPTWL